MTEPSQYFKGRTVQEQMDEVIGYVDKRAEEVAAAKADDVLQPAEAAKTAAQAAAQEAEAAKNDTITALPAIQQDISDLKAENVALDGRLNTVELKVQTAEGNIVTIQGQIVALQNVQGDYVKKAGAAQTVTSQIMVPTTATGLRDTQIANGTRIQNDLDAYAQMVRTTGAQSIVGNKTFTDLIIRRVAFLDIETIPETALSLSILNVVDKNGVSAGNIGGVETATQSYRTFTSRAKMSDGSVKSLSLQLRIDRGTNKFVVQVAWPDGTYTTLAEKTIS